MANRYEQLLIEQYNKSCGEGRICTDPRQQRRQCGVVEGFLQDVTQILEICEELEECSSREHAQSLGIGGTEMLNSSVGSNDSWGPGVDG